MTKNEIVNLFNLGLSQDIESIKLCEGIINTIYPKMSYDLYIKDWWNIYAYNNKYIFFKNYLFHLRNRFFPELVYSTVSDSFKWYD